jgi:uncharacterized protein YutE (UPF0331/DUF86 family)
MSTLIETKASREVEENALRYRNRGYEVITDPQFFNLPIALAQFSSFIDAVARKEENCIFVVIKKRSVLVGNDDLVELTKAVKSNKNWQVALVILKDEMDTLIENDVMVLRPKKVFYVKGIKEIENLLTVGQTTLALTTAWTLTVYAIQKLAKKEKIKVDSDKTIILITELVHMGVIPEEDYQLILKAFKARNAVVYQLETDVDLSRITRQLFEYLKTIT